MTTSRISGSARLADRLGALRDKYFVGRSAELDAFRFALQHEPADRRVSVVFVHGPGGVGKSVLLRQFARLAEASGRTICALDGRDFEPSPSGLLGSLRALLHLDERASPVEAFLQQRPLALLIDRYEVLTPLDTWLRELFLPQVPEESLVVLGSRNQPSVGWREDPAWSELALVVPLRNLPPSDSRTYLSRRGVPETQHAAVLEFTHGHPLALSLLADQLIHEPSRPFRPERAPDVVRTLLERFVDRVPGQAHWQALAVCAHARATTETLLADVLGAAEAPGLFAWLRDLPFIEQGPAGLFPHDVAREVLEADLRWRDPVAYRDLHSRIRDSLATRLRTGRPLEQQAAYFDFMYLVRHGSVSKAYYDWASFGHLYAEVAAPEDHAEIITMVGQHEGDESAHLARYWLGRQPAAFVVFRAASQRVAGFSAALLLEAVTADDLLDPAIAAAWRFIARRAPLRPGEAVMHHRFFVGRDGYQDRATHNMVALVATSRWLTTPRLAWSFPVVAEPDLWAPLFESIRFARTPEADFVVGGHRYGAFAHDWRVDPMERWLEIKTALDPTGSDAAHIGEHPAPELEVLSQPDFERAVRDALKDLLKPSLAANPLLRSRMAFDHSGGAPGVASLRALIREAACELQGHPGSRSDKLYRVLACTYLEPSPTQELAAERLGLPFNTYRYQLAAAIKRVTDSLWQRELHVTSQTSSAKEA